LSMKTVALADPVILPPVTSGSSRSLLEQVLALTPVGNEARGFNTCDSGYFIIV
jgi:hypothetical protein